MSVYKRGRVWYYNFTYRGQRFNGSTHLDLKDHAQAFETELRRALRLRDAGLAPQFLETVTPRFTDWAEVFYREHGRTLRRPDELEHLIRVVLRFWGARPKQVDPAFAGEPYHDLRLGDPIRDPSWIDRFEAWMDARRVAGSTRNHYRSTLSGMYRLALRPRHRQASGVTQNPFRDVARDPTRGRTVTVSVDELQRWITAASYHVRLAVAIAALAPKLRLSNILSLRWRDLDAGWQWLTVAEHKTVGKTARPLVVPVSDQLRSILQDAQRRQALPSPWVVTYAGRPLVSIRTGVTNAAKAAGLVYGRGVEDGVTFHTLRHAMATLLAELGLPEKVRQEVMGHADLGTTQGYTHLRPVHQREPHTRLAEVVSIVDIVTAPGLRAKRAAGGGVAKSVARGSATSTKT